MRYGRALLQLSLLCFACCIATHGTQQQCSSQQHKELTLVLTSGRSEQGNWISQAKLDHHRGDELNGGPYEVRLQRDTKHCEEVDSVEGLVTGPPILQPPTDAEGYRHFAGLGRYRLYLTHMDWYDAQNTCEQKGAHLAVINSEREAMALLRVFAHHLDIHHSSYWDDQAYIGVRQGDYVTVTGEKLDAAGYNRWKMDGSGEGDSKQHCVTLRRNGLLNDISCSEKICFFCEKKL